MAWESGWSTIQTLNSENKIRNWVLEEATGDLYLHSGPYFAEDGHIYIAIKASLIFSLLPLYCAGVMVANVLIASFQIVRLQDPSSSLWQILRSPPYAATMMVAALTALIFPMQGRKWIGQVERAWHQENSYAEIAKDLRHRKVLFLALCMQPRKNLQSLTDKRLSLKEGANGNNDK